MRRDFDGVFYQIEVLDEREGFVPTDRATWLTASFDYFGEPHRDFTASGECWQTTGHHGTFSQKIGEEAVFALSRKFAGKVFRLVRRVVSWKTEEVMKICLQGDNPST